MRKMEQIKKQYLDTQAKKERLQSDIDRLKKDKAAVEEAARACASAGDLSGYQAKKKNVESISDEIAMKEIMLANCSTIPLEDAKVAWDEYAATASKELEKRKANVKKKIEEFHSAFIELLDFNFKTLEDQENIAFYTSGERAPVSATATGSTLFRDFPLKTLTHADVANSCQFFLQCELMTQDYDRMVARAVRFQRAPEKFYDR